MRSARTEPRYNPAMRPPRYVPFVGGLLGYLMAGAVMSVDGLLPSGVAGLIVAPIVSVLSMATIATVAANWYLRRALGNGGHGLNRDAPSPAAQSRDVRSG
jgi:predicted lipid-binding transport protein (Tim44 family)